MIHPGLPHTGCAAAFFAPQNTNPPARAALPFRLGDAFCARRVLLLVFVDLANAACEVFDALQWKNVVGTLSGDDTFLIVARSERDAKTICSELTRHIG